MFETALHCTALIQSKVNAVHILPSHFFKIHCNIIPRQFLSLLHSMIRSGFAIKILYSFFISPMRDKCSFQHEAGTMLPTWLTLRSWRWRRHVSPKCLLTFTGLYGVMYQNT
jgi:hypothetical protein